MYKLSPEEIITTIQEYHYPYQNDLIQQNDIKMASVAADTQLSHIVEELKNDEELRDDIIVAVAKTVNSKPILCKDIVLLTDKLLTLIANQIKGV